MKGECVMKIEGMNKDVAKVIVKKAAKAVEDMYEIKEIMQAYYDDDKHAVRDFVISAEYKRTHVYSVAKLKEQVKATLKDFGANNIYVRVLDCPMSYLYTLDICFDIKKRTYKEFIA